MLSLDSGLAAVIAEIEKRYELWGQPGKFKVTGFVNRGRAGRFQDAITLAEITGEPADIIAVIFNHISGHRRVSCGRPSMGHRIR